MNNTCTSRLFSFYLLPSASQGFLYKSVQKMNSQQHIWCVILMNFRMLNIILFNFMFHKSFSIAGSITFNLHINQSRWFSLFAQESCKLKFWTYDTYCVNTWHRRVLQNAKWSWKRCAFSNWILFKDWKGLKCYIQMNIKNAVFSKSSYFTYEFSGEVKI